MSAAPIQRDTPMSMAVYWFNQKRSSTMSVADARAFEVWLARDSKNEAAFQKVEQTWSYLGDLEDEPAIMDAREEERGRHRRLRMRRLSLAAAGVFALAAGGVLLTDTRELQKLPWFHAPSQAFATTLGQRATITLPDQSIVTLDTNTVLRARITPWSRRIELERGQAYFQVAKDKSRPFIVAAAGKTVRATGTAFDVRSETGRFEVTLIEGRVRVEELGAKREDVPVADMRPGWRLAVAEDARWRIEPVDMKKVTAWHDGMLSFFNEPVAGAAAEMNRYSRKKIVFRGAPPKKPMLGNFRAGDVDQLVNALEINGFARVVEEDEQRVVLVSR